MDALINKTTIDNKERQRINGIITSHGSLDIPQAIHYLKNNVHSDEQLNRFMECLKCLDSDRALTDEKDLDTFTGLYGIDFPYIDEISYEYFKDDSTIKRLVQSLAFIPREELRRPYLNSFYYTIWFKVDDSEVMSLAKVTKPQLIHELQRYQFTRENKAIPEPYQYHYGNTPSRIDQPLKTGIADLLNQHTKAYNNKIKDKIWNILQEAHPAFSVIQNIQKPYKIQYILREAYPEVFQADNQRYYRYNYLF